jgi:hypothetical protein
MGRWLGLVVLALVLVGCEFSVFEPPSVVAVVDAEGLVRSPANLVVVPLRAGEAVWVRVNVGSRPSSELPLLSVFEVGASGVSVEVFSSWGGRVAESSSRGSFSRDFGLLSVGDVGEVREALSVVWDCAGPCVLERFRSGSFFVRLSSAVSVSVPLRVFAVVEWDEFEPNDSAEAATLVPVGVSSVVRVGALERVSDSDFFRVVCLVPLDGVRIRFLSSFSGDVRLLGRELNVRKNSWSPVVGCGEAVYVKSVGGEGGSSAVSGYSLEFVPFRY